MLTKAGILPASSMLLILRTGARLCLDQGRNAAFGGSSALDVLLGGELTGIMRVRHYLDAERGGW